MDGARRRTSVSFARVHRGRRHSTIRTGIADPGARGSDYHVQGALNLEFRIWNLEFRLWNARPVSTAPSSSTCRTNSNFSTLNSQFPEAGAEDLMARRTRTFLRHLFAGPLGLLLLAAISTSAAA